MEFNHFYNNLCNRGDCKTVFDSQIKYFKTHIFLNLDLSPKILKYMLHLPSIYYFNFPTHNIEYDNTNTTSVVLYSQRKVQTKLILICLMKNDKVYVFIFN